MNPFAAIVLVAVLPLAVAAQEEKAAALVRQLGDRSFKVREEADRQLHGMGRAAFTALQAGLAHPNAEVRQRCKQILPAIFEQEMKARLDAFLNDTDPANDHGLPGWQRFRKMVGSSQTDRELFGRMIRADVRLMDAVENRPKSFVGDRLAARCFQIQMQLQSRDLSVRDSVQFSDVAQLLFLGCHPDLTLTPAATQLVNALTYQPVLRYRLQTGDHTAAAKTLLLAWIDRNADDANTGNMIANLLMTTGMKEFVAPALRTAANRKLMAYARAQALVAVGRAGGKEHVAKIESIMTDETCVTPFALNNLRGQTQVRDVALAMAIHVCGQKPADFGFEALKANPNFIQSYHYLGFANDEARSAAQKKWATWKKENEKPAK